MMRSPLTRLLLLGVALAFVAACPRSKPPSGSPDAGPELDAGVDGDDASVACALPGPADAGVPWRESCALKQPVDPCSQLVLPEAGPVPTADRWCEDSARIRCAAWVDAGTVDPTAEAGCAQFEGARCASRFPTSLVDAGYLSYWPAAAWECLRGAGPPDSPACGCAFVRGGLGAPCANDLNCRSGYCLEDASDAGTCVECPPLRPLGSSCGRAEGDAPCDREGTCAQGCCVPRPTTGESCGGRPYVSCHPDTSTCSDTCIETCSGGTCRAHKGAGEVCGLDPFCGLRPSQLCNLGTCGPGLVCTYVSSEPSSYAQCQPTGMRCNGNWDGCAPGQVCTAPFGRCILPSSLGEGEACEGPRQCAEGLVCRSADAGSGGPRVCTVGEPGECGFSSECPWEQGCVGGQCTTPLPLGARCDSSRACGSYLVCAKGPDGGTCAPLPRRGEPCVFKEPDGGYPWWMYGCIEGSCNNVSGRCE